MASSRPNYEEELKQALETFISFNAYVEKAKLDPEKYPNLGQSMNTFISLTKEMIHKARDAENSCREYLIACQPSLLRPTPGRDKDEDKPTDSGIGSAIIAEESGEADGKEVSSSTVLTEDSEA
ncbi:hypothetical protein CHS0354_043128 [Potamilus streckersoni]|uniref:Uncharacterized protein n=1 Tax=Potamilus streckersoni TaxID=2493646 RepID=A0AAE0VSX3_9BIVA|nr:hypothetical protein CHS0354_043128 [Potamilus streckersoni]